MIYTNESEDLYVCTYVCLSAFSNQTTEPILTVDGSMESLGHWPGPIFMKGHACTMNIHDSLNTHVVHVFKRSTVK